MQRQRGRAACGAVVRTLTSCLRVFDECSRLIREFFDEPFQNFHLLSTGSTPDLSKNFVGRRAFQCDVCRSLVAYRTDSPEIQGIIRATHRLIHNMADV